MRRNRYAVIRSFIIITAVAVTLAFSVAGDENGKEKAKKWGGLLEFAFNASDGNTRTQGGHFSADVKRDTKPHVMEFKSNYRSQGDEGGTTEENYYTNFKYSYFLKDKFFSFLSQELVIDRFKNINLRSISSAGFGYVFVDTKEIYFSSDLGLAFTDTDFHSASDKDSIAARVGMDMRKRLTESLEFENSLIVTPSLKDKDNVLVRNEAAFSTSIATQWKFRIGHILDFDNQPVLGSKRADHEYFAALLYKF